MNLPIFKYVFQDGPLPKEKLNNKIKQGNCRLAIQLYFYKNHEKYFKPKDILNPYGYKNTGKFIFGPEQKIDFSKLRKGDVIYAQRKINKKGEKISRDKKDFKNEDEWILNFHTAIYLGNNKIYHSTIFEENSCVWTLNKFNKFFKPIAIKKFL
ncbi:hypothetical protein K8R32_04905 [bacterium]|nr:hypothetical protein [bacterium]